MQQINGFTVREAPNDVPTRCLCCDRPRRLNVFRNGPRTRLAVCPNTRAAIILSDSTPVLTGGIYTGSLDGV